MLEEKKEETLMEGRLKKSDAISPRLADQILHLCLLYHQALVFPASSAGTIPRPPAAAAAVVMARAGAAAVAVAGIW